MKRLLSRILGALGLVSTRRYEALTQQLEENRAAAREWKARASQLQSDLRQQAREAEKTELRLAKLTRRREDVQHLRSRLAQAERELAVAREHLMAIEVKLDILEGAANVLDIRTRAAIAQQRGETSARI